MGGVFCPCSHSQRQLRAMSAEVDTVGQPNGITPCATMQGRECGDALPAFRWGQVFLREPSNMGSER